MLVFVVGPSLIVLLCAQREAVVGRPGSPVAPRRDRSGFLFSIAYVWLCALTGRRGALLRIAVTALAGEGVVVIANRGDCPLGGLQGRLGDPVPLFELVLSPRAARRVVPLLGLITAAGVALLAKGADGPDSTAPSTAAH